MHLMRINKSLLVVSERPPVGNKNSMMSMIEDNNRSFVSNSINLDSAITPSERKGSSRINLEDFELNPGYGKLIPEDNFQRQIHNKQSTHKPSRCLKIEDEAQRKLSGLEENKNEIFSLRYDKSNNSSDKDSDKNGSDYREANDPSDNTDELQDNKIKPFDGDQTDDYADILPSIQSGSFDTKEKKGDHFEPRILGASQFEDSKLDNDIDELEGELQDNVDSQRNELKIDRIQIDTIDSKRVATAGIPIRNFTKAQQIHINVYKPVTPRREGLETARSARRMVNKDTQRGIMGNVWISDLHNKEREEQNQETYDKQTSLGVQGKKSTKHDDEFHLDDLDKVLDNFDSPETKPVNSNKKSDKSSIFSMYDKQYDNYTFSSLDLSPGKNDKKRKQMFDLEISDDFTDLKQDLS